MYHGIAIVGANGSGKTTLGKYLAELLGYKHMDAEDYSFKDSALPFTNPRTKEEVRELMMEDIKKNRRFILTSVNGDYGSAINGLYDCIVYIQAPLDVRLQRVKQRTLDKYGDRALEGGDMYEQEQRFFDFVAKRTMERTDAWVQGMKCPVMYLDGREPIAANAKRIVEAMVK